MRRVGRDERQIGRPASQIRQSVVLGAEPWPGCSDSPCSPTYLSAYAHSAAADYLRSQGECEQERGAAT